MTKPLKKTAPKRVPPVEHLPRIPKVGDRVTASNSPTVWEISRVHYGGDEVNLAIKDTLIERLRVPIDRLTYLDEAKPEPVAAPEPAFDAAEIIERITNVQRESTQRLDDDIALLTKYLKTKDVPKSVISLLETLRSDQQKSWQRTIDKITELLDE